MHAFAAASKAIPNPIPDRSAFALTEATLSQSALLIIDVQQHCSVAGEGCWEGVGRGEREYFFDHVDSMTANISRLLDVTRRVGRTERVYTVIESLTQDGRDISIDYKLSKNATTGKPLFVPYGAKGADILPLIAPRRDLNEVVIPKTSCSVFQSTNINYVLRNMDVKHLFVCGQLTNQCVESAVRDAADLGFFVTIIEDACAALTTEEHTGALHNMKGFGRIINTDQAVKEFSGEVKSTAPTVATTTTPPPNVEPKEGRPSLAEQRGYARAIRTALLAAGVRWLRVVICDYSSRIRAKAIHLKDTSLDESPERILDGVGIIQAVNGMANYACCIEAATGLSPSRLDKILPEFSTLTIPPYNPTYAIVYGKIVGPDRSATPLCPRSFLQKQMDVAAESGLYVCAGVEFEFALFETDKVSGMDKQNFCFASSRSLDTKAGAFLDSFVEALGEQHNICANVELAHREGGTSQYEMVLRYNENLMKVADSVVTVRETLSAIASKFNLSASLLPKIDAGLGAGMHIHLSIRDPMTNKNILHSAHSAHGLSEKGEFFLGGILANLDALQAVVMASSNSYRRMQPGYWTGSLKNWGFDDKEAALRVCRDESRGVPLHAEIKIADATLNPYLAFGCILIAGTSGILDKVRLPKELEGPPLERTFAGALAVFEERFVTSTPAAYRSRDYTTVQTALKVYHALKSGEDAVNGKLTLEEEVAKYFDFY